MSKHRKTHKRRHHIVGAMSLNPASPLVKVIATAAGYFLGDTINPLIDKVIPSSIFPIPIATTPPTAPGTGFGALGFNANTAAVVVEGGLGYYLLMKGRKSVIKTAAGGLLAGAGLKRLLKTTGIVSGYQAVPVIGRHRMGGYQAVPVIGGMPAQLAGNPAQLEGFRINGSNGRPNNGYGSQGSGVLGRVGGLYEGHGLAGADSGSGSGITNESGSECMY